MSSALFPERIRVWRPGRGCSDTYRNGFEQNKFDNNLKWKMRGGTGENTGREGEQRGILSPSAQAAVLHPVKMQSGRSDGQSTIGPKEELSWER